MAQPVTAVRDWLGKESPLQATISYDFEVNGNQSISATILPSEVNRRFIADITEMWTVIDHFGVEQKIVYLQRRGQGKEQSVQIKGIPLFFDAMNSDRIYERVDKHMTAMESFTRIFENTGFTFVLADSFDAVEWEGFGEGESRLESFKRALDRYEAEFYIRGKQVTLKKLIGRDLQTMYAHRLNASNITLEHDASALWTYAKGFGDYGDGEGSEDWQDAKLVREYTSPLAKIIGIRHAPPLKNGNITTVATMDEQLKTLVDESLKISVTADIHDLRKQGYPIGQPEVGDRVYLVDERIGFNEQVRVVDMKLVLDWRGDVRDINLTFGTPGLSQRYQARMSSAMSAVTDLLEGKIKLPPSSVYDEAMKNAVTAIQNAQSELDFPVQGGIIAIGRDNPNKQVWFNSEGLMVSVDAGAGAKAAITGEGVVTEMLTAGTINGNRISIRGGDASNYTYIDGPTIISAKGNDSTTINGGNIASYGRFERKFIHNGREVTAYYRTKITSGNGVYRVAVLEKNDALGNSLTTTAELDSRGLYLHDKGISSQPDNFGNGVNQTGRYIDLFAQETYNSKFTRSGMKIFSDSRLELATGLETSVVINSDSSAHVESSKSSVYIKPHRDVRPGNNTFQYLVEDSGSSATTHGVLLYGSEVNGMATGIRFSKNLNDPRITILGHLTVGGNVTLHNIINADPTVSIYCGVGGGEFAVTNNNLANNGDPSYRPVRASAFHQASSRDYKTNIVPIDDVGLSVIRPLNVVEYELIDEGITEGTKPRHVGLIAEDSYAVATVDGKAINTYALTSFNTKAIQELAVWSETLERRIKALEGIA